MQSSIRYGLVAAFAATAVLAAPLGSVQADNHISNTGAAILGGVAGLALGAAIVDSQNHRQVYYPPRYQPYPYPQPYPYARPYPYAQPYPYPQPYPVYYPAPRYAAPFSPAPGVTCDPARGRCFNDNGTLANRWTIRVFGG